MLLQFTCVHKIKAYWGAGCLWETCIAFLKWRGFSLQLGVSNMIYDILYFRGVLCHFDLCMLFWDEHLALPYWLWLIRDCFRNVFVALDREIFFSSCVFLAFEIFRWQIFLWQILLLRYFFGRSYFWNISLADLTFEIFLAFAHDVWEAVSCPSYLSNYSRSISRVHWIFCMIPHFIQLPDWYYDIIRDCLLVRFPDWHECGFPNSLLCYPALQPSQSKSHRICSEYIESHF